MHLRALALLGLFGLAAAGHSSDSSSSDSSSSSSEEDAAGSFFLLAPYVVHPSDAGAACSALGMALAEVTDARVTEVARVLRDAAIPAAIVGTVTTAMTHKPTVIRGPALMALQARVDGQGEVVAAAFAPLDESQRISAPAMCVGPLKREKELRLLRSVAYTVAVNLDIVGKNGKQKTGLQLTKRAVRRAKRTIEAANHVRTQVEKLLARAEPLKKSGGSHDKRTLVEIKASVDTLLASMDEFTKKIFHEYHFKEMTASRAAAATSNARAEN